MSLGYTSSVARTHAALAVLVLAAAAWLIPEATASVDSGTIVANRGVAGVTLGATRAGVIERLGRPLSENRGTSAMSYSRKNLFDIYLDPNSGRVRLVVASGPGFCVSRELCLLERGGVARLKARYGTALKRVSVEGSERALRLTGTYRGRRVFTQFSVDRNAPGGRITQVTVGYFV